MKNRRSFSLEFAFIIKTSLFIIRTLKKSSSQAQKIIKRILQVLNPNFVLQSLLSRSNSILTLKLFLNFYRFGCSETMKYE
jgi:hypothetical protein